ncbi:MAG: hypothetical protein HY892_02290 [Deltaproteobacteria bacterium]|nr:hypothetical protein [Deltaproteobacteria bacterium]
MKDEYLLDQLEALAQRLGISVRYEMLSGEEASGAGGLCRVKGRPVVIIHTQAATHVKIRILIESLKQFPLDDFYLKPALRELLEGPGD